MKRLAWLVGLHILVFTLLWLYLLSSGRNPAASECGVFVLRQEFQTTVLELRPDGRFRYWLDSDVHWDGEPRYPLTGRYIVRGDDVYLLHLRLPEFRWSFRHFDGQLTLWRPSALRCWAEKHDVDTYGVLVRSAEPAEQAFARWHEGPATQPSTPVPRRTGSNGAITP